MSQPQEGTSRNKAKQAHDQEMEKKHKQGKLERKESQTSKKKPSLDELLAKANRLIEEAKERDKKLRIMEQVSRSLRFMNYDIEGLGLAGTQTEMLNQLKSAVKKVDAEDDKIAQFAAFTQQISKKCDEMEQEMAQVALHDPSGSSASGSQSGEKLDKSASGSINQETEDIL